jgi:hypothetical protein
MKSDLIIKNYGDQIKENKRGRGHVAFMGNMKYSYILVGISEGKKSIGKHRSRWEVSNRVNLM